MTIKVTSTNLAAFFSVSLSLYSLPHADGIAKVALHWTRTNMYTHRSAESEAKVCSLSIFPSVTYPSLVAESSLKNILHVYSPNVHSCCKSPSILTHTYPTYPLASDFISSSWPILYNNAWILSIFSLSLRYFTPSLIRNQNSNSLHELIIPFAAIFKYSVLCSCFHSILTICISASMPGLITLLK